MTGQESDRLYHVRGANQAVGALVDASTGGVVERVLHKPYGRPTVLNGAQDAGDPAVAYGEWTKDADGKSDWDNQVLWCGYRHDPETGLYHVRNRMYHPTLSRWLSRDPLGYIDGPNLYGYCGNAPGSATDPWGCSMMVGDMPPMVGDVPQYESPKISSVYWVPPVGVPIEMQLTIPVVLDVLLWPGEGPAEATQAYPWEGDASWWASVRQRFARRSPDISNDEYVAEWVKGFGEGHVDLVRGPLDLIAGYAIDPLCQNPEDYLYFRDGRTNPVAHRVLRLKRIQRKTQEIRDSQGYGAASWHSSTEMWKLYADDVLGVLEALLSDEPEESGRAWGRVHGGAAAAEGMGMLYTTVVSPRIAPKSTGGFRSMMEPAEAARYDAYWQGLTKRAPIQAQPYEIIPRYTSNGMIESYTTYDKLGYRAYQYEFAPGVRDGPGYHVFDQTPPLGGSGKGPRGPHIPFDGQN